MEPGLVIGLSIAAILFLTLIMERLRLPPVLGMLIAGSLIGPFSPLKEVSSPALDLSPIIVTDPSVVGTFALIGSALILFGIGLEFSIMNILRLGFPTIIAAAIKNAVVLLVGYQAALALGFPQPAAFLLAALLSFSSTPIIIKLLEDRGSIRRPEVPLIVSILIIEDFLAVFLLAVFSSFSPAAGGQQDFMLPLLKALLAFAFSYVLLSRLITHIFSRIAHSDELLTLTTISLVLLLGYFSQWAGLGFSVGAFLAGSVLAGSAQVRRITDIIRPFNTVFASLFFFSIGLLVDIRAIAAALPLTLTLAAIAIFAKFIGSALSAYLIGFSGRSACFIAVSLLALSEMSLLIAREATASGILSPAILSISAGIIILTSLLSVLLAPREAALYSAFISILPPQMVSEGRALRIMSLNARRLITESFRYRNIIDTLPIASSERRQARPAEQFEQSGANALQFLFISLLSLFVLAYTTPAQVLSALFLLVYLASSLLFIINLKGLIDSLSLILFPRERSSPLLELVKGMAGLSAFLLLSLAELAVFFIFPKTDSYLLSLLSLLLSLSYLPKAAGAVLSLLKKLRPGL